MRAAPPSTDGVTNRSRRGVDLRVVKDKVRSLEYALCGPDGISSPQRRWPR